MKQNKLTVYVAGPIRGMANLNLDEFRFVEKLLHDKGYNVIVPHDLFDGIDTSGYTQADYMAVCIPAVRNADCVCFLDGWKDSPGSKDEMEAAIEASVKVVFAKNEFSEYAHRDVVLIENKGGTL
jgi:hypothetical protein